MSEITRKRVCEVVSTSHEPIDPENISKNLGIGWGTALKYALELVIEGKIHGLRTTKGWIFWNGRLSKNECIGGQFVG